VWILNLTNGGNFSFRKNKREKVERRERGEEGRERVGGAEDGEERMNHFP
jgi:hypothetical protein